MFASNLGGVDLAQYFPRLMDGTAVAFIDPAETAALAAARPRAVAWIPRGEKVGRAEVEAMTSCRLISVWGVGYDNVDVAAATAHHIPVCINPVFARSMAEAGLTLILALAKRLPKLARDARRGHVPTNSERGLEIAGKTLGVVGLGRIGRKLAELAGALGMRIVAFDPYLKPEAFAPYTQAWTMPNLLAASDFVVLAAPLAPETRHLIGADELALMKPSAYLINIARGPLVDEVALVAALQAGQLAGAGLDVWEKEPVQPDHPLLAMDNVIGTPHRIGATWESLQALCTSIEDNVLRVIAGNRPENAVNPEAME